MPEPLIPEDAVFPDKESREMAEQVAKDLQEKEAAQKAATEQEHKPDPEKKPEDSETKPDPNEPDKPQEGKEGDEGEEEDKEDKGTVPAWQFRAFQKQTRKQLEKLTELVSAAIKPNATPEEKKDAAEQVTAVDDQLKAFAEKHGWDLEMLTDMRKALGVSQLPPEVAEVAEQAKQQKVALEQETGFKNELSEVLEQHPEYKGIDQEKLKELAFGDQFKSYRLSDIIALNKDALIPKGGRKTFESPTGGNRNDDAIDLTREQPGEVIAQLTPKQFEVYSENMAKLSKGTLTRDGRPVK